MTLNGAENFQRAYKKLSEHICEHDLTQKCSQDFASLSSNAARVKYLLNTQGVKELLAFTPSKSAKNLSSALSLKNEGNKYFQKKNPARALLSYNRALTMTPLVADEGLLALCYANRSAALYSMKKYKECLADIEIAINHRYPNDMLYKLTTRRAKCHQYNNTDLFMASVQQALDSLELSSLDNTGRDLWKREIIKLAIDVDSVPISNITFAVPRIERTNDMYPALNSCASVYESNEYGRYIRADANISPGDVVLTEKPFCSITLPDHYSTHCCHCQKKVDLIHPCRSCADIVYCSRECEQSSWVEYHCYECNHIVNIKYVDINMGHLSLRSALKAGYKTLTYILEGNADELESCEYYDTVYSLQGHEENRSNRDLFWRTAAAIVLAQLCDLDQWSESANNALSTVATFILHHMQVFPCNAHEISQVIYDDKEPCQSALGEIGAGIYATLSLFNHSCDPTVVRIFHNGNTCVMKALSPIDKSDQVYDNYGCLYATHSSQDRQCKLSSQYYFQCCCAACLQNWGLYDGLLYTDTPLYKCMGCQSMMIPPVGEKCDKCDVPFDQLNIDGQLAKAKKEFDEILAELFTTNRKKEGILDQINKLEDYSKLVNSLVFRPYKTLNDCQEALKHLYGLLGNVVLKSETSGAII